MESSAVTTRTDPIQIDSLSPVLIIEDLVGIFIAKEYSYNYQRILFKQSLIIFIS